MLFLFHLMFNTSRAFTLISSFCFPVTLHPRAVPDMALSHFPEKYPFSLSSFWRIYRLNYQFNPKDKYLHCINEEEVTFINMAEYNFAIHSFSISLQRSILLTKAVSCQDGCPPLRQLSSLLLQII